MIKPFCQNHPKCDPKCKGDGCNHPDCKEDPRCPNGERDESMSFLRNTVKVYDK